VAQSVKSQTEQKEEKEAGVRKKKKEIVKQKLQ
jgi:hypothetical protein